MRPISNFTVTVHPLNFAVQFKTMYYALYSTYF